jgi:hypothetical protein
MVGMLFTLKGLRALLAPATSLHKPIPWQSVTGRTPLVTKIEFDGRDYKSAGRDQARAMLLAQLAKE